MSGIKVRGNSLTKNTFMLYVLTASNYVFAFASIPYLTRVLGSNAYGQIGFAGAFSSYVQLILDFGFTLSATRSVSKCRGDKNAISEVLTSATSAKLVLALGSSVVVGVVVVFVPQFSDDPLLYVLYLLYCIVNCLMPDFVYRGIERMTAITVRTVIIKATFLVCIILFVKSPSDYHLVPVFYMLGALISLVTVLIHLKFSLGIWFAKPDTSLVLLRLKESAEYFLSRISSTFYSSLNTLVLGVFFPGSAALGYYTACNNAVHAGRSMVTPVSDSMYPYMLRTKNYPLLVKVILIGEVILIPGCIVMGIFANWVCALVFGAEYYEAGEFLRYMIPLVPISLASYLLGFPALSPMGKADTANRTVVAGAVLQSVLLLALWVTSSLTFVSVCIATLVTELFVVALRAVVFARGLKEEKRGKPDDGS